MPTLEQTLLAHELALLRAIAAQAGLELNAANARAAAAELALALQQPETLELLLDRALDPAARGALALLIHGGGRQPAAAFIRRFGDVRPLGPAAQAREQPWQNPITASEALYFNGLAGRGFMDSETGPQEFFYVPADLLALLPALPGPPASAAPAEAVAAVEVAEAAEPAAPGSLARLVDETVTVLAALQLHPGREPAAADLAPHLHLPVLDFVLALGADLGLIQADRKLDPDKVKPFLNAGRGEQLLALARAWRDSTSWNELLHLPGLRAEPGAWRNDPAVARAFVLKLCAGLPAGEWRSLDSLVAYVREHQPDFQRPNGDYDSWYIREAASGEYLRGFANWDRVDGALIRYLLTGPMLWLGLVDGRSEPEAIRLTGLFRAFAAGEPFDIAETPQKIGVGRAGTLSAAPAVNRFDRFQAARIGEWLPPAPDGTYVYRLTGNSLQAAAAQGITARHLLAFLRRSAEYVPDHVAKLIERWGQHGIEARALNTTVLKLSSPDVLEMLMRSPRTRRWLGEALGERSVEVKDWEKLREAMVELGLAAEFLQRR